MLTDEQIKQNMAVNVRRLMADRNLTQTALAKKIGETQGTISNIAIGKHMPSVAVLCRIADVFDVSIDRLVAAPPEKLSASA